MKRHLLEDLLIVVGFAGIGAIVRGVGARGPGDYAPEPLTLSQGLKEFAILTAVGSAGMLFYRYKHKGPPR